MRMEDKKCQVSCHNFFIGKWLGQGGPSPFNIKIAPKRRGYFYYIFSIPSIMPWKLPPLCIVDILRITPGNLQVPREEHINTSPLFLQIYSGGLLMPLYLRQTLSLPSVYTYLYYMLH